MTLHLVTLILGFNNYKWVDNSIEVIEKENMFVVRGEHDVEIMKLIPAIILKSKVGVVLAPQHTSLRQISLSIYCLNKDLAESKDKLITEIRGLSEAYRLGFEHQKTILENITHENKV